VFCLSLPIGAQTLGTLSGQVTDPSGSVVPGATVTATGPGGVERSGTADVRGEYSLAGLSPGPHMVVAMAPDLATPAPARVVITGGTVRLDIRLAIEARQDSVKVQDDAAPAVGVDTTSNASGITMKGEDLQALADDPEDLQADLQALAGPSAGPSGGAIFIDGFRGGEMPPKNAIREIRINQNPFSAEYDKLGYGRVEVFTKPGSADLHAEADYNLGTDIWNSRNPYSDRKAPFLLNEFEGSASGRLGKHSSFTVDAQHNLVDNGFVVNAVTLDPQSLAVNPFTSVFRTPQRFTKVTPRIDHQLNETNTIFLRYGITRIDIDGAGIGGFDLISRGYHSQFTNQTVQASDTKVIGAGINETRFQWYRSAGRRVAKTAEPATQVLDSFNGGGSPLGRNVDTLNTYELQNYTSKVRGAHTFRFGVRLAAQTDDNQSPQNFNGTFTFGGGLAPVLDAANYPVSSAAGPVLEQISSIERYRRTLLLQRLGFPAAQIREFGGGATQFSVSAGNPAASVHQLDGAVFAGDDWRLRPNFTLSLGVRYEVQTNIHDWRSLAPRLAVAWAPGGIGTGRKTVLRAGFGIFYDRFALANTLTARRYDGSVQQQYVVANPNFFPVIPPLSTLAAFQGSQIVQRLASDLRAPYIMQSALSLERQLSSSVTAAFTYTNSGGMHVLRSQAINAPLPGTYDPTKPGSGVFPYPQSGPIFLMTSSGIYRQNQFIANINAKVGRTISLFSFYALNKANSDSDGLGTFPANPWDYSREYGPASTDVRHRATVGGSIGTKWNVRLSPFIIVQSGAPFNITAGSDLYGTSLFNGRPGIATDRSRPGLVQTQYGLLDPNPAPGETLLSRNYGRAPGQITVNLRITKAIGFGPRKGGAAAASKAPIAATADPAGTGGAPAGRTIRNLLGSSASERRYNLILGLSGRNLLNHNNPGPIVGNITSPLFGFSNQTNMLPNGEGFSENANNRRLEMQIRFTF
jgi:hypothetical protein